MMIQSMLIQRPRTERSHFSTYDDEVLRFRLRRQDRRYSGRGSRDGMGRAVRNKVASRKVTDERADIITAPYSRTAGPYGDRAHSSVYGPARTAA